MLFCCYKEANHKFLYRTQRKFIAGVGNVTLFKGGELILTAKTLVDTSISFSVTLEDIRAGQGAKLYGKYAHTTGMTMKLTDAMWRLEMLGANIGADPGRVGGTAISTYQVTALANGALDLAGAQPSVPYENAKPLPGTGNEAYVYYAPVGDSDTAWTKVSLTDLTADSGIISDTGIAEGTKVCIKFVSDLDAQKTLRVSGNFIPDTLTAVVEVPLFAGDSSGTASTKIGKVIITIPRFMLNGTMELSMTMTGASQTAIEGSALAVTSADCLADEDYYAIISEVIDGANPYEGLKMIAIEADAGEIIAAPGATVSLNVYAIFNSGLPALMKYNPSGIDGYKLFGTAIETTTIEADGSFEMPQIASEAAGVTTATITVNGVDYSDVVTLKNPTEGE